LSRATPRAGNGPAKRGQWVRIPPAPSASSAPFGTCRSHIEPLRGRQGMQPASTPRFPCGFSAATSMRTLCQFRSVPGESPGRFAVKLGCETRRGPGLGGGWPAPRSRVRKRFRGVETAGQGPQMSFLTHCFR
jgi:hypothetical protein